MQQTIDAVQVANSLVLLVVDDSGCRRDRERGKVLTNVMSMWKESEEVACVPQGDILVIILFFQLLIHAHGDRVES